MDTPPARFSLMSLPKYPRAERTDTVDVLHGHAVADPYRWLEDPTDPRTVQWVTDQDELLNSDAQSWPGRDSVADRLRELLAAGVISAPIWRGDRQFFMRRTADQEHAVLLTIDPDGSERELIDPIALDPNGLTTLDTWQPSKEGDLLAYQISVGGTEESVLRVMEVSSGENVDGPIDRARYSPVAWLPGGKHYYYVRRLAPELVPGDEEQYHRRVWLHELGTDPSQDLEIFGAGRLITEYFGVSVSRDGRWLEVTAAEGTAPRNDVWLADLSASSLESPTLVEVQAGIDAQTGVYVGRDGRLYVHTDRDAPRGRVCVTSPERPGFDDWQEFLPQDPVAVLNDFAILDGDELDRPLMLVSWTRHAISEISIHDLATGRRIGEVPLPGLGSIGGIIERPEGGHEAWFNYTDHVTSSSVRRYDARTGDVSVWANAPGTVEVPEVHTRLVEYPSLDATIVRMSLLSPTETPESPRPTILYGYGGFGVPMTPGYSATALAWVEAGGVFATANLRGGGEEGEEWHRDGMLGNKQNSFDDFHAAADWLIAQGWTTREQLAINGGSNGGLLVGATLTQRPDLINAVVCSAPLLDMIRYEKFGLGATWNVEYGSVAVAEEFEWLLAYSPYHHVTDAVNYPAVLFTIFDGDTRVDPMHARKMCTALQHATSGDRPILIRIEGEVGHGARSISRSVNLSADTLAFTAKWTGLSLTP